jgi:hypothetical protein
MNFPTFLNKSIIGFKPIKGSAFWYWYRFMCHSDMRLDDRHLSADFWYELNYGWWTMEYDAERMSPEADEAAMSIRPPEDMSDTIYLTEEQYDAILDAIENPPPPTPFLRQLLSRPTPWDNDYEQN